MRRENGLIVLFVCFSHDKVIRYCAPLLQSVSIHQRRSFLGR